MENIEGCSEVDTESKIKKSVIAILKLDEDEAKWLKGLMQNPIGCSQDEEEKKIKDKLMRELFWKALAEIK